MKLRILFVLSVMMSSLPAQAFIRDMCCNPNTNVGLTAGWCVLTQNGASTLNTALNMYDTHPDAFHPGDSFVGGNCRSADACSRTPISSLG